MAKRKETQKSKDTIAELNELAKALRPFRDASPSDLPYEIQESVERLWEEVNEAIDAAKEQPCR